MLFYIRCPTCGRIISYNLDKYYEEMENIANDPKMSKQDKDKMMSELLIKFGYKPICCRIKIMGLIPYHKIIVS